MVKVLVTKDKHGTYRGFTSSGHAGYADAGEDIICSALSMLQINTINAIERIALCNVLSKSDAKKGLLEVKFSDDFNEKAEVLMDAMILGIESVIESYGKQYVSLKIKEQ